MINRNPTSLARVIAELFRADGYDGTSMARIGKETGLLKGSLYHHFPGGKKSMASAALLSVADEFGQIQSILSNTSESPRTRLTQWSERLSEFYAHGQNNCLLGSFVLSGGLVAVSENVKQAFTAWIDELAQVLIDEGFTKSEARRRAQSSLERIQGALVLARALNDSSSFQRLMRDLPEILLSH